MGSSKGLADVYLISTHILPAMCKRAMSCNKRASLHAYVQVINLLLSPSVVLKLSALTVLLIYIILLSLMVSHFSSVLVPYLPGICRFFSYVYY